MMKRAMFFSTAAIAIAAITLMACGVSRATSAAQDAIAGDWTAKVRETSTGQKLWLTMTSNREGREGRRGWFNTSSDYPLQDFSGLNTNAGGAVRFTLAREAGTVVFDGLFKDGRGVGEFRFTPDGGFINAMRGLGYETPATEKLFTMALHDVGTRFINELKSHGYEKVPIDKLVAMGIHRVNGEFIRSLQSAGYSGISVDKLIAMRIHNVDAAFIARAKAMGYGDLPVDKLLTMRIHNIDEEFIKGVQSLGYNASTARTPTTSRKWKSSATAAFRSTNSSPCASTASAANSSGRCAIRATTTSALTT
jgi:hypothetical protein